MSNNFNNALEEALNSVTMTEVLNHGEILEDISEEERYFSDAEGGEEIRLRIIRYNEKIYCHKEKNITYPVFKSECIAFYELREEKGVIKMDGNDFRKAIINATEYLFTSHHDVVTFHEPIEITNVITGEKKKVIPTLCYQEVYDDK